MIDILKLRRLPSNKWVATYTVFHSSSQPTLNYTGEWTPPEMAFLSEHDLLWHALESPNRVLDFEIQQELNLAVNLVRSGRKF